ncbi:MAG: hypothetical protein KGJ23_08745 [Euryarchaeota archaeon]|nr:hypothetical protein [Euryarchaeota archaeon]MDE1836691.1 hypothetical protein [Euryarchaeota archaeon]MDE1880280.1 hypothetical protein [Euryarchaeota archaeon]MDE2044661.1 hypothetical protein [Thermoplasmata archaeon]
MGDRDRNAGRDRGRTQNRYGEDRRPRWGGGQRGRSRDGDGPRVQYDREHPRQGPERGPREPRPEPTPEEFANLRVLALAEVKGEPAGLIAFDIAQRLKIPTFTARKVLRSLEDDGFVHSVAEQKRW